MCKVSIIIPIYNTGELLNRCAESIITQTLNDIEIILVDDGSTDESGKICDELAERDSRIKVVHKSNEGVSIARNTGIKMAKGEYIGFIDSDDWIEPNMYLDLYNKAQEANVEIVMCDTVTKYDEKDDEQDTISQLNTTALVERKDIYPKLLMEMAGSACRCIYKTEMIYEHNVEFPVGLKFSEDRIFNILAMGYSNGIFYIKKAYYNRYVRKGSAVSRHYDDMIDIVLDARMRIFGAIDEAWAGNQKLKETYENQTVGLALSAVNNEFYKNSKGNFFHKYNNIKKICKNKVIKSAVKVCDMKDLRLFFVKYNLIIPLCAIAVVLNKKHGR